MTPWIISPNSRRPSRIENGILEIIIGGDFNFWEYPIQINGEFIEPLSIERITNTRGGYRPFKKITVDGFEFGEYIIQLGKQQPFTFYVNPLY